MKKHDIIIIGAGPSGLSCAYQLARLGHRVTIREAGSMSGGMMRFGIPRYRLPRDILDAEVQRILDIGVTLELNTKVEDVEAAFAEGFDAKNSNLAVLRKMNRLFWRQDKLS